MKRKVKQTGSAARGRGRPRSEAARGAILAAAQALLAEGGPGAVTMEAVAERAGVGKPTVYRWWPDRHAVAMAALMAGAAELPARRPRSVLAGLRAQLKTIAARFATPTGRHMASMLAAADQDSELSKSFRNHFVLTQRQEGLALLAQAVAQGELRSDARLEVVADMLYGPLFFRLLLGHAPLDERFVQQLLDHVLAGAGAPSP